MTDSSAKIGVRHRIADPNSAPRSIKFVGLGHGGHRMACAVARHRMRNVEVLTPETQAAVTPLGQEGEPAELLRAIGVENSAMMKVMQGANMVFIAAAVGDDLSFAPLVGNLSRRMGVLVTAILIQPADLDDAAARAERAALRKASDLLVIASDESYALDMLSALGA
ncbi:hypothetical protein SAMN06265795_11035 [Noviherbaspirillum humi]|uniref:Uncharacterized protein n=1 Tax=Noviherbaspirillum humi TaxID=1688639 RepID=A0A239IMW4_9BURK|nr:hypothetical protein [Noviherbaspirillum humi]SNS94927.1 hypothetical protein SAMN06265795_11035 [Noviherbaspirillum humi]